MKGFGVVEEDAAAVVIAFAVRDPTAELVDAADCARVQTEPRTRFVCGSPWIVYRRLQHHSL